MMSEEAAVLLAPLPEALFATGEWGRGTVVDDLEGSGMSRAASFGAALNWLHDMPRDRRVDCNVRLTGRVTRGGQRYDAAAAMGQQGGGVILPLWCDRCGRVYMDPVLLEQHKQRSACAMKK